jgi:hypothetical protein
MPNRGYTRHHPSLLSLHSPMLTAHSRCYRLAHTYTDVNGSGNGGNRGRQTHPSPVWQYVIYHLKYSEGDVNISQLVTSICHYALSKLPLMIGVVESVDIVKDRGDALVYIFLPTCSLSFVLATVIVISLLVTKHVNIGVIGFVSLVDNTYRLGTTDDLERCEDADSLLPLWILCNQYGLGCNPSPRHKASWNHCGVYSSLKFI